MESIWGNAGAKESVKGIVLKRHGASEEQLFRHCTYPKGIVNRFLKDSKESGAISSSL